MKISQTIRERRTIKEFNGKPLDPSIIMKLLNDAIWAPFHSRKEPWSFIMFTGDGRKKFAEAIALTYSEEMRQLWGKWAMHQYCELMQVHLLVVFDADPRQKYWEDAFAATAALIQNLQLLAWEQGIGVVWKTNECNWDPAFHRAVGLHAGQRIAGVLHFGYFDRIPKPRKRQTIEQLLTHIDS